MDRARDLLADGAHRQVHAAHQHHGLHPGQRVAGGIRVQRGERAVVSRIHGLEHVQRFPAPALADDDAVGPHPQRIAHQVPDGDLPLAFDVRRPRLQLDPVLLRELQLGGVLDGDDPFLLRDASRQDIQ